VCLSEVMLGQARKLLFFFFYISVIRAQSLQHDPGTHTDNYPNPPFVSQQQLCTISEFPDLMDSRYDDVKSHPIFMTPSEKILFSRYLMNSTVYYEFGTGGSTLFACSLLYSDSKLQTFFSIDSDEGFLKNLIQQSDCLQQNSQEKFYPIYSPIGPVKEFGYPIRNPNLTLAKQMDLWLAYPQSILSLAKNYKLFPDFVLIDGRFRVASALFALLLLPSNGFIAIHDFSPRPQYYAILKYYEPVDCVNSLLIAKQKERINWKEYYQDLTYYLNDPE
jgi:hypothetical protein